MQKVKPKGQSVKEMVHYGQIVSSRRFSQYNHGTQKNMVRYGSMTPPVYNLSHVTCPVAVFVGDRDALATPLVSDSNTNSNNHVQSKMIPESLHFNTHKQFFVDVKVVSTQGDSTIEVFVCHFLCCFNATFLQFSCFFVGTSLIGK